MVSFTERKLFIIAQMRRWEGKGGEGRGGRSLTPTEHDLGYKGHHEHLSMRDSLILLETPTSKYSKSSVLRQSKVVIRKHQGHTQGPDCAATLCGLSPAIATTAALLARASDLSLCGSVSLPVK